MAAFLAGLATLAGPELLSQAAQGLFWVHMDQHLLLMTVAPPLLLLGAPWTRVLRGVPLGLRRSLARAIYRGRAAAVLLGTWRTLRRPRPVVAIFLVNLWTWHLVSFYQLTLANGIIHHVEHALLFLTGLALWALLVDSPPLFAGLAPAGRVVVATVAMMGCWAMSVILAFAPYAFYPGYSGLLSRPGGFSALTDQQLGAGMMWGPGSIPLAIVVFMSLAAWLQADTEPASPARVRADG
jgi:cytochrome c oxidase assembly factor CtaG